MALWPRSRRVTIPLVRLSGAIGISSPLRPGLSLAAIECALDRAFATKAPCVALSINSPGGSAAQSSMIYSRIRALADEKERHVIAFVEDVAASGGYWLANAADEIFADATSIVGSIGVITASFGFTELIEKIGIERRVYTAGKNKSILDPFKPEREDDIAILKSVQADIHEAFVTAIRERRGPRLSEEPDLFSGQFWSGTAGIKLGLVDGIGQPRTILRERYGKKVRIKKVTSPRGFLRGRIGMGFDGGTLSADALIGAVRTDRLYDRYGL
ncbi:MAG: S49 family peptidase [Pseudomonadota bacterium]